MISNQAKGKQLIGDILQISTEAKLAKLNDPTIIDATVGALYDENYKFYKFYTVDEIIKNLSDNEFYTYSPSDGGKDFKNAVLKWVFQDELALILSNMHHQVVATAGGTGAVSNAIYNSCDPNETILIPDLFWGPYKNMAITNHLNIEYYEFLHDNHFNFNDFKLMANNIINKEHKLTTIINDPCNNPSGYTFTNEELQAVINYMNNMPEVNFSLIYDIAYIDFSFSGMAKTREKFKILSQANKNIIINICFSASKSFAIYGLRTGAHIILGKNKDIVEALYQSSNYLARTRWSNATKAGISLLIKVTQDEVVFKKMIDEIEVAKALLKKRSEVFLEEAKKENLIVNPYFGGFFMTLPVSNSMEVFNALKNIGIYTLPFKNALRLSISAMPLNDIKGLALKIKKTMTSSGKNN